MINAAIRQLLASFAPAALIAGAGLLLTADAAWGEILHSQARQTGSAVGISLTEGGNDFGFADRRRADNFTLATAGSVELVRWWGGTESNFFGPTNLSNVAGFNIRIFESDGGLPGDIIYEESFAFAATNATQIAGEQVGFLGAAMFSFDVTLSTPVDLDAGTEYWISVAADLVNPVGLNFEGWQWAGSPEGDDQIAQRNFDGAGYFINETAAVKNAAVVLEGSPAPGCTEDLTGDGVINSDDLFQLLGAWGACVDCDEDLTGDDAVNSDDLFQLLGAWGAC